MRALMAFACAISVLVLFTPSGVLAFLVFVSSACGAAVVTAVRGRDRCRSPKGNGTRYSSGSP